MRDSLAGQTESLASLKAFLVYVTRYQEQFVKVKDDINQVHAWFTAGSISQEQRQLAINAFISLHEPIEAFCTLIESKNQLTESILPLRYPLADSLYQLQEHTDNLLLCLNNIPATQHSSALKKKKVQSLRSISYLLLQTYEDSLQKISVLRDQIYFQLKKLNRLELIEHEKDKNQGGGIIDLKNRIRYKSNIL